MFESIFGEYNQQVVTSAVVIAGLVALYWVASRAGRRLVDRIASRGDDSAARAQTLWSVVRRIIGIAIVTVLVLTVASVWDVPLAPFLAVGSAVGVALGFGAQDLVKDVISGFFIIAEDQFHIGDVITIAGVTGVVVDIRLRVTVLRDLDGNAHYVPNGQIEVATNLTQVYSQVVFDIGVAYKESVDQVMEVIADELTKMAADPDWEPRIIEPPTMMGVERLDDSAVIIRSMLKVTADDRWLVKREALRRLKNRLDAEGIEIPFPHLTLYRGDAG